jgi:hypothetical protein
MRRLLLLVFWPRAVWADLRARPVAPGRLLLGVLLPLALGITLAHRVGAVWLNTEWSPTYGWPSQQLFGAATGWVIFGLALGGPLALAAVFAWLAPWCGGRRDFDASLAVATWGTAPLLVAACGLFFMPMIVVCLLAAVLCFRLYAEGVCALLQVPPEDGPNLVIGSWLAMGALASFTGLGLRVL